MVVENIKQSAVPKRDADPKEAFQNEKYFYICHWCLATGKQDDRHRTSHQYCVIDSLNKKLFVDGWSMKDEL